MQYSNVMLSSLCETHVWSSHHVFYGVLLTHSPKLGMWDIAPSAR